MTSAKNDFTHRDVGIDLFRALTMFVMIFVNDFWKIHGVPHWLEHAAYGEDFMGLADVVFPCFLFAVGLSIPYAIERRYSKGASGESVIGHILSRTLALLIMGAFITNSEARLSPDVSYRIGVYWFLMVGAFILIWNHYPKSDNPNRKKLYLLFKFIGLIILFYLAVTFRNPDGGVFGARWGILGAIGWTYLVCGLIYVFTRDRLNYLIPVWFVFVIICILGTRMNASWGETAILDLPRGNFYNEMLRILHIGNGALPAFTMGGVILSLVSMKLRHKSTKRRALYTLIAVAVFFLAGVVSRQFWILAKIGSTPPWVFFVTAICIGTYAILLWLAEQDKAWWFNIIKPAGTATLTCYLVPYVWYGVADVTGYVLPDYLTHGIVGLIKCLLFAFAIIGITYLLGRIHIKLKI
jgi:protein-S-isoprenylcysteine O-methyltransferase Ste14